MQKIIENYCKNSSIKERVTEFGHYLYDADSETVYSLNETYSLIWNKCNDIFSTFSIIEQISSDYGKDDEIISDIICAIKEMLDNRLIIKVS